MTVYADILFATNLVVNYLLLALSTQLVRQNPKRLRLLISAVVGAIGSFEMLFQLPIYISIPFKFILCMSMTAIANGISNRKMYLKSTLAFLIVSFSLGGTLTAVLNLINTSNASATLMGVYFNISPLVLIILTVLAYIIVLVCQRLTMKVQIKNDRYNIVITCTDQTLKCMALLDTGSSIHDVYTGNPVVVVSSDLLNQPLTNQNGYRFIPYSTVGENGVLEAFRPKSVEVEIDGKFVTFENVTVAKSAEPLQNGLGALLPSDMAIKL